MSAYQNHELRVQRLRELPADLKLCDTPEAVASYWEENVTTATWYNPDVECLCVIHMNTRRRACGFNLVSIGILDTILVHAREVFRAAIVASAKSIVLAHNHPSGDHEPSEADVRVTHEMVRAGRILGIQVVDHVIIGRNSFTSLRGTGGLNP